MAIPARRDIHQPLVVLTTTVLVIVVFGFAYWARAVTIPLALAILLTFILGPAVTALRRLRIGRIPAVLITVFSTLIVVSLVAALISWQITVLVRELPNHQDQISARLESMRGWFGGELGSRFSNFLQDIDETIKGKPGPPPVPVEVVSGSSNWLSSLEAVLGPAAESAARVLFTIVLVAFLLASKDDMLDRVLRLIGPRRLTATTKAISDAANRISRYLRTQLLINSSFALIIAIALFVLGVRFAFLWGFVGGLMRYVPYIGVWIGLIPPLLASFAMSNNWWEPVALIGVYSAVELVVANIVEPRLLGRSLGISEVAQLVSAAFWALLWGPIGLILSGPITAVLLVIGKNVPQLHSLEILLGDEEALSPPLAFFQRLAAQDRDEAWHIAETFAGSNPPDRFCDDLVLPELAMVQIALDRRELSPEDAEWIIQTTREIAEEFAAKSAEAPEHDVGGENVALLAIPADGAGDSLALELLEQRLHGSHWDITRLGEGALASEALAAVREKRPAVVVIGTVSADSLTHTRYLCKRLRRADPNVKLLVGRWGAGPVPMEIRADLLSAGIDDIVPELVAMQKLLETLWTTLSAASRETQATANSHREPVVGTASAL